MRRDPRLAAGGPAALVQAALERLRTGGYSYTLEPGVYGEHTADEFWFDRKEGFCEHIASAFVVLMRAMDIPARIVTGYQGGELNAVDGFWVVRQSDAHAWTEVWLAGHGWVRVDPTVGRGARAAPARSSGCGAARACSPARSAPSPRPRGKLARRLGGDEQQLEPVGAELHAEPAARPAAATWASSRPSWEDLSLRAADRPGGGGPGRRGLDLVGAQPARPLAAAAATVRASAWTGPESSCRPTAPPRQIATAVTTRFGRTRPADWQTGC